MTTWRHFAHKTFPIVLRETGIPCATSDVGERTHCPRHGNPIPPVTSICLDCHTEAWDEVGRRYAAQALEAEPERRGSTFRGPIRKPLAGQLSLLAEETTNEEETMNTSTEPVQNELLPAVIEETASAPLTLFGTSDPQVALQRMADVASVLVGVIKDRKLFARISGHEHITAEGWTTLGGMLGIVPIVCWSKPNETGDGYLARVEARTLEGRVVGAAESECSRAERKWKTAEPYAIRSMAQTRAIGRALRAPLGQIVVLAGYEASSAEEMPVLDAKYETADPAREGDPIPNPNKPTDDQVAELHRVLARLATVQPDVDWKARARAIAGVPGDMLTRTLTERLLWMLGQELEVRQGEEASAA